MYAKTQATAISISHVISMYGPATDMPLNMTNIQISLCTHMTTMPV